MDGRPYRTVFEPSESRKPPEVNLLDTLLAPYDELDRGKTYPDVAWEPKLGLYALADAYRARDRTLTGTR